MKFKNILITVTILALGGAVLWWFTQPAAQAPSSAKIAAAPATLRPALSMPASKPAQVEAPKAAPAVPDPVSASSVTTSDSTKGDPQMELGTAIDDMATMLQAGDMPGLLEKYTSPEQMAKVSPEQKAVMAQRIQQQMTDPHVQQMQQSVAQILWSFKSQTPEMNATGDEATYQMTPTADMAPPGEPLPASVPMTFIKIDGRWYLKSGI